MSECKVLIEYTGLTNKREERHLSMIKVMPSEPCAGDAISEAFDGHVQTIIAKECERIGHTSQPEYRVVAVPDDRVVSYVDDIARAFEHNGWYSPPTTC